MDLGGELALSAVVIMMSVVTLVLCQSWIKSGDSPLNGYNYGAENFEGQGDPAKGVIGATSMQWSVLL
jgi:hypothetical protein